MPIPHVTDDDFDGGIADEFSFFNSVESLKRHDDLVLIDKGDTATNNWLRSKGYGADGEPLKRGVKNKT